jgi:hypothetical protein
LAGCLVPLAEQGQQNLLSEFFSFIPYNEVVDAPDRDPAVEHRRRAVHR